MNPIPGTSEYGINPRHDPRRTLDPRELFGNDNPVTLEIGSGKGRFLLTEGRANPGRNYLGIEKSLHYYRVIVDRLERHALPNTRIINEDAAVVLREMLPEDSIDELHIYFPDPWPRKRERKRRMIRPEVMPLFVRVLSAKGKGIWVTDHEEYFHSALPVLEEWFDVEAGPAMGEPRTNYEAKYRAAGRPIWEARFRRSAGKESRALSASRDG